MIGLQLEQPQKVSSMSIPSKGIVTRICSCGSFAKHLNRFKHSLHVILSQASHSNLHKSQFNFFLEIEEIRATFHPGSRPLLLYLISFYRSVQQFSPFTVKRPSVKIFNSDKEPSFTSHKYNFPFLVLFSLLPKRSI